MQQNQDGRYAVVGGQVNRLYFVRHGDYNHSDGSLTVRGAAQAVAIGARLAELDRKYVIFTSPYTRTAETASIIASCVDSLDVIEKQSLREHLSGETREELLDRAYAMNRIIGESRTHDVVIVSHRDVLMAMLESLLNEDPRKIRLDKGTVYELSNSDGSVRYEDRWGG